MKRADLTAERGFTLVEILVVVLIAAVLAAIALPLFINQRTKAQDGEARAAATVVVKALMVWHQENETFSGAGVAELAAIEPTVSAARGLVVTGTGDSYEVRVDSAAGTEGGGPFTIEHDPSGTVRRCGGAGRGGCPDDGLW
jgi:prepilin-type N-terminal cleavage/methylation domain-containing protein